MRQKNPLGPLRCPKCRNPIQKDWKKCSNCDLSLEVACPKCGKTTFFGDYCEHCDARLVVACPNPKCKTEQPPNGDKCIKCGKPLKGGD
ncbi:MAG: double zinc ribbon domain-containing protein [bacterium]